MKWGYQSQWSEQYGDVRWCGPVRVTLYSEAGIDVWGGFLPSASVKIDGVPQSFSWTRTFTLATHGLHTVEYSYTAEDGTVTSDILVYAIDAISPATVPDLFYLPVTATRYGAPAEFTYYLYDMGSKYDYLTLKVWDAKGHLVKTWDIGHTYVNKEYEAKSFYKQVTLKPGLYTWRVYAQDYTGNAQGVAIASKLLVN